MKIVLDGDELAKLKSYLEAYGDAFSKRDVAGQEQTRGCIQDYISALLTHVFQLKHF
jgi:hypothetical protein